MDISFRTTAAESLRPLAVRRSTPDPASLPLAIEAWFAEHQRPLPWRLTYDPYRVWISEVMLQQTRMEVVLRYFEPFLASFPDVRSLAAADEDEVLARWSGLGYYRRARMLRAGAAALVERFGGSLPGTIEELLTIPGVGRYTAGAITSISYQQHSPIVDGNVARIMARLFGIPFPTGSGPLLREAWKHSSELVGHCADPRAFNQGLMELGALVCRPANPLCTLCPVSAHCIAFATNRTGELPAPKTIAPVHQLRIPLYLISDGLGRVLMRREKGKLMQGMYHLPHGKPLLLSAAPLEVTEKVRLGSFRHTITNRRIEFTVWSAEVGDTIADGTAAGYEWIEAKDLPSVAHPSYVAKALGLAAKKSTLPVRG